MGCVRSPETNCRVCSPGASPVSSRLPTAKVDQRFRSGQRQVHRRHFLGIHQQVMVTGVFLWLSIRQHQPAGQTPGPDQTTRTGPRTVLPFLGIRISTFAPLGDGLRGMRPSELRDRCPPDRSIISVSSQEWFRRLWRMRERASLCCRIVQTIWNARLFRSRRFGGGPSVSAWAAASSSAAFVKAAAAC